MLLSLRIIVGAICFSAISIMGYFYSDNIITYIFYYILVLAITSILVYKPHIVIELKDILVECFYLLSAIKNKVLCSPFPLYENIKFIHGSPELQHLAWQNTIKIYKCKNNFIEIHFKKINHFNWYNYSGINFAVDYRNGYIQKIEIDMKYLLNRGGLIRNNSKTEWAKYYNSVLMAHIEVLKFSQRKYSPQLTLAHKFFKNHGEVIFAWVLETE